MHELGYIKEIKTDSVIFIVDTGDIEIEVDMMTKDAIEEIFQANDEALIPFGCRTWKSDYKQLKNINKYGNTIIEFPVGSSFFTL